MMFWKYTLRILINILFVAGFVMLVRYMFTDKMDQIFAMIALILVELKSYDDEINDLKDIVRSKDQ